MKLLYKGRYFAKDIAKEIIIYSNEKSYEISNFKLQNLLFLIQIHYWETRHQSCFKDKIEAWAVGPVIPTVYNNYKFFGALNIPSEIFKTTDSFVHNFIDTNSRNQLHEADKDIIHIIVDTNSKYTSAELSEKAKSQISYIKAYVPNLNPPREILIPSNVE